MHGQIVDLCSREESTAAAAASSEIYKYYLAESLLQGSPTKNTYAEALNSTQVFGKGKELSACEITQKTKALFLDRKDEQAKKFLLEEYNKKTDLKIERQKLLVAMYDSVMKTKKGKVLSFDEFKERHEKSRLLSQRLISQAYAVQNLRKIVHDNDYDGIDNAFNLYMVLRQIRDLMGEKYMLLENDQVARMDASQ